MNHDLYSLLEPLIVALIVLVSAVVIVRKHAPRLWTRLTGRAGASSCHDSGSSDGASACGTGCGGCGSSAKEQPIQVHRQPSDQRELSQQ